MTQFSLFEDGLSSFTLSEFLGNVNDFEWLKSSSTLGTEHENELDRYYSLEYGKDSPPLYLADPLNATVTGKTTYHALIVRFEDGDSVLVVYRSLEFMKKRIHAFDIPISITGNKEHALKIIDAMLNTKFVTFIFKEKYRSYFSEAYPKEQYNDYYYDLEQENLIHFSNHVWLKKHYVNTLVGNDDYQIIDIHGHPEWTKKALECRRMWFEGRNDGRKTDNERKYFENSLKCPDGRISEIAIAYRQSRILAIKTILVHRDKGYATDIMFSHVSRSRKAVMEACPEISNGVMSNLDECMRYATGVFLLNQGIQIEYRLGFVPENRSLKEHKERVTSGKIPYFSTVKER